MYNTGACGGPMHTVFKNTLSIINASLTSKRARFGEHERLDPAMSTNNRKSDMHRHMIACNPSQDERRANSPTGVSWDLMVRGPRHPTGLSGHMNQGTAHTHPAHHCVQPAHAHASGQADVFALVWQASVCASMRPAMMALSMGLSARAGHTSFRALKASLVSCKS